VAYNFKLRSNYQLEPKQESSITSTSKPEMENQPESNWQQVLLHKIYFDRKVHGLRFKEK